ncbi:diguanylate cyclase [Salinimonas marina]|uniref:diguanylate cyclase n=1 Tax=Salinimonas marina TaxID=2785918 RepID=A0A7S9HDL4_9ALTE|nr:diguanylate cyclase [Salinimonas marina]QPG06052.1 diguanylate cyclase [Salinimonas marina]
MTFEENRPRTLDDCQVLIVDDQISSLLIMETLLADIAQCHTVSSASAAMEFCATNRPDLVITDVNMPGFSGHELSQKLHLKPETKQIPVIFVTASDDDEEQEQCWAAGGVDFVIKPINATTFRNRVKFHLSHKLKSDLLETLIYTDRLTGAFNRHYLEERLPAIVKDCIRDQQPLSVAIFDIDFFKQYNDEYGHPAGDECLWQLSSAVQNTLMRPMDHLIRIGGEEFMVLLPNTSGAGAKVVCQRLLETIRALNIEHKHTDTGYVTVSIGHSIFSPEQQLPIEQVISQADRHLYQAKAQGRNRFVCSHG